MNKLITCCLLLALSAANLPAQDGASAYRQKPVDREAFYFPVSDGKKDVSRELQEAINQVKKEYGFGIVFIPEGVYRISKTIYIPRAIRLIGYGKERPLVVLSKNSPGFQQEAPGDKGRAGYMFWFVNSVPEEGRQVADAGASTFYSAMSNINLKIEDGNPHAVALRTHFAQHSFVSHIDIQIGNGKAGLFEVGNEMHNVRFYGGDYGIYTTKASPGWPMMMVDTYFEKQKKAAIRTQEGGLTIVRLHARNVPTVLDIEPNYSDRLFLENCLFDNVSGPAIVVSNENNAGNQISLKNVDCRNVPVLVKYRRSETITNGKGKIYRVTHYTHGLHIDNLAAEPEIRTDAAMEELTGLPPMAESDIPALPDISAWVNIQDLGARGDNETDDTEAFREAIRKHANIYVPQGWYIISEPLVLQANTSLIGLNPVSTQLILKESTPAFSGFGSPVALVETPRDGMNIVNGLGLNTGAYNYRAVGCKWMAGARSYMNDVKFMGGHGGMNKGPQQPWRGTPQGISSPSKPAAAQGMDYAWDNQYWSLWITSGGGGTFKDIWTASTYCTNGVYVSNTSTEGRIYAMSIEHHVRNEARFSHVSNWKVYAFQLEEESRESRYCQPLELDNCSDMVFANLYMFQVIRVNTPYPYSVRTWNCRGIEMLNVHNYAQTKYAAALPLYDANTGLEVRPWEFTRLYISGKEKRTTPLDINLAGKVQQHAAGFEFAQGTAGDSKGNIYFCEQRLRRLYKWSAETNTVSPLADFPWEPLSLACDTKDNLLVVFRYNPQPGYMVDGKQESVRQLPDAGGTSFSGWGNSGFATWVYSINPDKVEESMGLLRKMPMDSVAGIHKALYPANRWRDYHDFNTVAISRPQECFVAPDGVTIIPCQYDLARACAVLEAFPGKPFYAADEYDKRMVRMDVAADGTLSGMSYFVEAGEFGSALDKDGNLYVADGQVYIYDKTGKRTGQINVPERPLTMAFGGKDKDILFINSHHSLFSVKIK